MAKLDSNYSHLLKNLLDKSPIINEAYDTASKHFEGYIEEVYKVLKISNLSVAYLENYFKQVNNPHHTIGALTALKIIQGYEDAKKLCGLLSSRNEQVTITVIQPMYHETPRISNRDKSNPAGEDALRYKLSTLNNIQQSCKNIKFRVLVVDDGCDGNLGIYKRSGVAAKEIIKDWRDHNPKSQIESRVIFLSDSLLEGSRIKVRGLKNIKQSVKGGAILYAMAYATQQWLPKTKRHLLLDYDADLSIHPALIPTLAKPILASNFLVAAGSRRESESVGLIDHHRDERGKRFISLWHKLLPTLALSVTDANRGFKMYDSTIVPTLLSKVKDTGIGYQVEMLLVAEKNFQHAIKPVPIAYIDSVNLSTLNDSAMETYTKMLLTILEIAKRHNEHYDRELGYLLIDHSKEIAKSSKKSSLQKLYNATLV